MLLRYRGSSDEIVSCLDIALVHSSTVLTLDKISDFTRGYFTNPISMQRKSPTEVFEFTEVGGITAHPGYDQSLNYIIIYSNLGTPIGIVDLQQNLNLKEFNVQSLKVNFEFTIINKEVDLNISLSYSSHQSDTENKLVHKNLLDSSRSSRKALNRTEVTVEPKNSVYTKSFVQSIKSGSLFRYSGRLHRDSRSEVPWSIDVSNLSLNDIKFMEIVDVNDRKVLITKHLSSDSKIILHDGVNTIERSIDVISKFDIGSNIILGSTARYTKCGSYKIETIKIYSTELLADPNVTLEDAALTDTIDLYKDGLGREFIKWSKDPITKVLRFYRNKSEFESMSKELSTYLNDLSEQIEIDDEIMYLGKELMITQSEGIDGLRWKVYTIDGRYEDGVGSLKETELNKLNEELYRVGINSDTNVDINEFGGFEPLSSRAFLICKNLESTRKDSLVREDIVDGSMDDMQYEIPNPTLDNNIYFNFMKTSLKWNSSIVEIKSNGSELVIHPLSLTSGVHNFSKFLRSGSLVSGFNILPLTHRGRLYGLGEVEGVMKVMEL